MFPSADLDFHGADLSDLAPLRGQRITRLNQCQAPPKVNYWLATAVSEAAVQIWDQRGGYRRCPEYAFFLWMMVKRRHPNSPARIGDPDLARAQMERYPRRQAEQLVKGGESVSFSQSEAPFLSAT